DGIMIDYSAGHIRTDEAALLIQALNEEIEDEDIVFYPGKSYRHIMVLRTDTPQEYMALKTVPPHDISDKNITGYLPQGRLDSRIRDLIARSREIFAGHSVNQVRIDLQENPATMIWLWGQGTKPNLEPFAQKYGLKGSIISAVDLVNGIGRLAGLDIIDVPGATGYFDTNYAGKAEYALKSLEDHDYVYVHIESPDEAGHVGSYKEKIRAIENIDKHIVGPIRDYVDAHPDSRMLVLPDHPTPVALRTHTHEPVGFAMYGKGIEHNGAELYNEESTRALGIKFKSGEEMIGWFVRENVCF
ncbi:MAG: 2,3-bisphosphoglycerate-independent phosphoglycerate mutase, partial [Candidatus Omnitrophica bacterium]|nr:2,3-bisphosphoglycerate-independent phosphoglycerate mutase [Candidatus Omnitrophota bacterium]